MKLPATFLSCILFIVNCDAQTRANTFSPNDLLVKTVKFDSKKAGPSPALPFSTFKVIDARFDTSKIGYTESSSIASTNRKYYEILKIKSGAAYSLQTYLNEHYAGQNSEKKYGLLIVLKKFWVTSTPPHNNHKYISIHNYRFNSRFLVNMELYIYKEDRYLPFRRIDTTIESMLSVKQLFKADDDDEKTGSKQTIYNLINSLVEQFDYTKPMDVFSNRKTLALEEIIASIDKRLSTPVLRDASIRKGVFVTFEEFKKNKPSIEKFKEKKPARGMRFIVDSTDSEITKYWGYHADFMKVGRYSSETVFRTGNTFDFFEKISVASVNTYSAPATSATPQIPLSAKNQYFYWIPYQVDMETGEFY